MATGIGMPVDPNSEIMRRIETLERQVRELGPSIAGSFQTTVDQLRAAQVLQVASMGAGPTGFTGWYGGATAQVVVTSESGRFEITYGGSANGGDAYFCYSAIAASGVVMSRDTILADMGRRVAVTGGASFMPSGFSVDLLQGPPGVPVTFRLEINAGQTYTYFGGGRILVRAVL